MGAPPEEAGMFDAYAEAGGNVIDTAVNYTDGASERIVGELLGSQRPLRGVDQVHARPIPTTRTPRGATART